MAKFVPVADEPPKMAGAPDPFQLSTASRGKRPLRIIFVDSQPYSRAAHVRHYVAKSTGECERHVLVGPESQWCSDTCFPQVSDQTSGSDEDYDDTVTQPRRRPRVGAKGTNLRRKKRHGKLTKADQDLIREAQTGPPASKPKVPKAARPAKIARRDALHLIAQVAEQIDWRKAVALQPELLPMSKRTAPAYGSVDGIVKLENLAASEESLAEDLQLRRYWTELITKSVLELNIK